MKNLLMASLLALFALSVAVPSYAGFLIEPYAAFQVSGEQDDGAPTEDMTGNFFGARLGLTTLGFMYGVEYMVGTQTIEETTPPDTDIDTTDMGVFIGYQFPFMFRVWASYMFSAEGDVDKSVLKVEGTATKFGIGYSGLPFVSINVEMYQKTYDDCTGVANCRTAIMGNRDIKHSGILVGLSIPLP